MKKPILLMVVSLLILPSALALNCTLFYGSKNELCEAVNPLDLSEEDKLSLMQDGVYGNIQLRDNSVNLKLNLQNQQTTTMVSLYEEKIVFISKILLIIIFNYFVYSFLTKSYKVRKWLTADC